jgi:integrase
MAAPAEAAPPRLLDLLRQQIRYLHYSRRTEYAYEYWVRSYMRLLEGVRLRVKDIDFDRRAIVVRHGKGGKDRVVMLPAALEQPLREQLQCSHALWAADRAQGIAGRAWAVVA